MPNISQLSDQIAAATALSNLIMVTPDSDVGYQPQNPETNTGQITKPADALFFQYEGENVINLQSSITDNYVEDNTAVQDHIALAPETVTVQGFVGELSDVVDPDGGIFGSVGAGAAVGLKYLKTAANRLTVVNAYVPDISVAALNAYNEAKFAYDVSVLVANAATSAWRATLGDSTGPTQTKQQIAFSQFYSYWQNRRLFTIQTPWRIFKDMAIMSLRAIQSPETRTVSDFEITFKQMKFTKTITKEKNVSTLNSRASNQAASLTDLGTSVPTQGPGLSAQLSAQGLA